MSPLRFDHVALACPDPAASARFYLEVLGFRQLAEERMGGRAVYTVAPPGGGPTLVLGPVAAAGTTLAGDRAHVGFVAHDAADRDAWKRRLAAHGVPVAVEDAGPDERLYFADPAGAVLEIERAAAPVESVVSETFLALPVADMARATAFYVTALGATVSFSSPRWSSLHLAGVRVGLALSPAPSPTASPEPARRSGLLLVVRDLAAACAAVERAGGRVITVPAEVAPGVVVAEAADAEGNVFALNAR